jgi:hypothetical protein
LQTRQLPPNGAPATALGSGLPDLVVASLGTNPTTPVAGLPFSVTAVISNQVTVAITTPFFTGLYVDRPGYGSPDSQAFVVELPEGVTATLSFSWTLSAGTHVLKAYVDWADEIPEADDNNNVQTMVVIVESPTATPTATPTTTQTQTPTPTPTVLVGGDFAISTAPINQTMPAVAWNAAANEFLVVWQDDRGGSMAIYGQRVAGTGALVGSNFAISAAPDDQYLPGVAWNATRNEHVLAGHDIRPGNAGYDIWGQRLDGNGGILGDSFAITAVWAWELCPKVAWSATADEYLVVWQDERNGAGGKGIAAAFSISENTVRIQVRNILEKLHLQNRSQAAVYAVRQGMAGGSSARQ